MHLLLLLLLMVNGLCVQMNELLDALEQYVDKVGVTAHYGRVGGVELLTQSGEAFEKARVEREYEIVLEFGELLFGQFALFD